MENGNGRRTAFLLATAKSSYRSDRPGKRAALQAYLDELQSTLRNINIETSQGQEFDDLVIEQIDSFLPYRDEFIECIAFLADHDLSEDVFEPVFDFFVEALPLQFSRRGPGSTSIEHDHIRFILNELFLYLIATLIQKKRYAEADRFLAEPYSFQSGGRTHTETFTAFNRGADSIDVDRNHRLKLNRKSLLADILLERIPEDRYSLKDLMQADFILSLRSVLGPEERLWPWRPYLLMFERKISPPFDIFLQARSKRRFDDFVQLLGVENKADLVERLATIKKQDWFAPKFYPPEVLMGLDELATR